MNCGNKGGGTEIMIIAELEPHTQVAWKPHCRCSHAREAGEVDELNKPTNRGKKVLAGSALAGKNAGESCDKDGNGDGDGKIEFGGVI